MYRIIWASILNRWKCDHISV